jgi:hypothetical protein
MRCALERRDTCGLNVELRADWPESLDAVVKRDSDRGLVGPRRDYRPGGAALDERSLGLCRR